MTRTGSCSTSNTCLAAQLSILTMEAPLSQEVADPRGSTGAGSTFQAKTQTGYRRERTIKPSQTIESKKRLKELEARVGIEPTHKGFADLPKPFVGFDDSRKLLETLDNRVWTYRRIQGETSRYSPQKSPQSFFALLLRYKWGVDTVFRLESALFRRSLFQGIWYMRTGGPVLCLLSLWLCQALPASSKNCSRSGWRD